MSAASGSAQMLNSAEARLVADVVTASHDDDLIDRRVIFGSMANAAAMLLSGPTGTSVIGDVVARKRLDQPLDGSGSCFVDVGSGSGSFVPCMSSSESRT